MIRIWKTKVNVLVENDTFIIYASVMCMLNRQVMAADPRRPSESLSNRDRDQDPYATFTVDLIVSSSLEIPLPNAALVLRSDYQTLCHISSI